MLASVNDASWNRVGPLLSETETVQLQRRDEELVQDELKAAAAIDQQLAKTKQMSDTRKAQELAKQRADERDKEVQNAHITEARAAMDRGEITLATQILEAATLQSLAQRGLGSNIRMALWLAQCYDAMDKHTELGQLFVMITGQAAPESPQQLTEALEKLCKQQSQLEAEEADAADLCAYKERVEAMAAMATAMKERAEAEEAERKLEEAQKELEIAVIQADPIAVKEAEAKVELMQRRWQKEHAEAEDALAEALIEAEQARIAEQTAVRERGEASSGDLEEPGWIEMATALESTIESDRKAGDWSKALNNANTASGLYEKAYGKKSVQMAELKNTLADLHNRLGDYQQANTYGRAALELLSAVVGEDAESTRRSLALVIENQHLTSSPLQQLVERGRASLVRRPAPDGPGSKLLMLVMGKYLYKDKYLWEDAQDRAWKAKQR